MRGGCSLKRANYTGCVYKLKGRRRKPWAVRISKGYDKNGKRIREVIGTFETKVEANKALSLYDISPTERHNIKLCEIYREWSSIKYPTISKSAVDNYKTSYKHLAQYHNKKFNDLRSAHFQLIVDLLKETRKRATLEKFRSLVNQLYLFAMENDICNKNYAKFIRLPKNARLEYDNFTILDIKKLMRYDKDHVVKIILMLLYTGYRPTALFEITKFNYDKKNRILVGGIKTEAGFDRPVPIHPDVQQYVDYFNSLNGETLFCNPSGKKYRHDNFRDRQYYPTLKKYGMRKILPRNCRHTFASIMKMSGADETAIIKMMGHEDYKFTEKTYTQLEAQYLHEQIEKIRIKD